MKKVLLPVAMLIAAVTATAGYLQPAPVEIFDFDDGSGFANGDMNTARTSDSDLVFIGCGIKRFAGGNDWGFCQARDASDEKRMCRTTDANLLSAMSALNDSSYILFSWDESGNCTRIDYSTQSFYLQDVNVTVTVAPNSHGQNKKQQNQDKKE